MERPITPQPPPPSPRRTAGTLSPDTGKAPPPRAFAQGTGILLQTTGMILFFSTCCICSLTGMWDPVLPRHEVFEQLQQKQPIGVTLVDLLQQPAKAGVMLMAMFMTVGGLAMAGFGLGLQAERPRSAQAAVTTHILMLAILIAAGIGIWTGQASWATRIWHAILIVVVVVQTGFTWVALKQMLAHPPPPGAEIIPKGYKIPYNFYHDDPPEVRLEKELANRRARLEAEQRELEQLEREFQQQKRDSVNQRPDG